MAKKKDLKTTVEDGIMAVLESGSEPSDGRLKALALGIKMVALNSKLEESEYGDFFNPAEQSGASGSVPAEGKRPRRKRSISSGDDGDPDPIIQ